MKTLLGNLPSWINKNRKWVLLSYLVLFLAAMGGAGKVTFDDSLDSWFDKGSSVLKNKRQFEDHFGSNEDLYIVFKAKDGDVFSEQSLLALDRLHETLESYTSVVNQNPDSGLSHIRDIRSLINEPVTVVNGDDLLIKPFIGSGVPFTESKREMLKQSALANPDFKLKYISNDAQYSAISIKTNFGIPAVNETNIDIDDQLLNIDFGSEELERTVSSSTRISTAEEVEQAPLDYAEYTKFMDDIRSTVADAGIDEQLQVFYTGLPELIAFQVVLQQEMGMIFLGLFALIFALSWILFRHLSAPVWTLSVIVLTLILTVGAIGFTGMPMSSLSQAMLLLVILISVADVVHILSAYKLQRQNGYDHESSMSLAFSKAAFSCFLATLTTVIGFTSLWIVKPSVPVANFGVMSALGLCFAFLVSISLLPVLMDIWKLKVLEINHGSDSNRRGKSLFGESVYAFIHRTTTSYPMIVLTVSAVMVLIVGMGIKNITVDTNTLEAFDESTEIRRSFEVADQHMGGTQNIDFMVEFGEVDAIYNGEVLRRIDSVQEHMHEAYPDLIVTSTSIINVLKQINQQLHQGDQSYYKLPESNGEISQLLFLFNNASPEDRKKLISEDFDATRISFSLKNAGSTAYVDIVKSAKDIGDRYFGDLAGTYENVNVSYTGGLVAFVTLFDKVTRSQILSFLVTLVVILMVLLAVFRSFKLGMLAMIPSLVPVVVTFGVMGWMGIALDNVTMIIAPIILGIAVDDSVHFIRKLQVVQSQTSDVSDALRKTLNEVGPALVFTSIVLAGGLLTMLLSSNASFQHFGYLSAIAIFSALLADLFMIPSICALSRPVNKESTQTEMAKDDRTIGSTLAGAAE